MRNVYVQMCDYGSRFRILKGGKISLVVSAFIMASTILHAAPTGGVVTSGSATIAQSGSTTTINQSTPKASINWNNFSIGSSEMVNFNQPNTSAITLNRVVGNEKSIIDGALNANGQVWILNSNGILFNANANVNTAGLLATTKTLSDADFQNGNYSFKGDSTASVINLGEMTITSGGYASLLANTVQNEGIIKAIQGTVTLTGASEATINLNGNSLVSLKVDKGVLDALVENKGAIIADGGKIYLTTNAVDELLKGVVNNTGILEANSLDDVTGEISLYAHGGTVNVAGTIEAKNGFVETSGDILHVKSDVSVKAKEWLLDPTDISIQNGGGTNIGGSSMDADTITTQLNAGTSVTLNATQDIGINESIVTGNMANDATLTFKAGRHITLASGVSIDATQNSNTNKLNLLFWADSDNSGDGINIITGTSLKTNGGFVKFGNDATATINGVSTLVGGDVYFNGGVAQSIETGGGSFTISGETILANTSGLTISTNNGNVEFKGALNSGNVYTYVDKTSSAGSGSWSDARTEAINSTGGGAAVGDSYLVTITSRLENAIAGKTANYKGVWIGAWRQDYTNGAWQWANGPEAGITFYNQNQNGNSGTTVSGYYSNYGSGEPNGAMNSSTAERAGQFFGTAGLWNDLSISTAYQNNPSNQYAVNGFVKETNLAASALVVNAGSGTVAFGGAVGNTKALNSLTVTATTTAINGGGITTEGTQTYNSNMTLGSASTILTQTNADTDFTFQSNKSVTNAYGSDASLIIKTTGNILMNQGVSISSSAGKLNTIFWADSDAYNNGYIFIHDGNTISTNGGDIVLAGGTDTNNDNRPDGFATSSTSNTSGVNIGQNSTAATTTTTLQSGGGDITIKGKSVATSGTGMGINYSYGGVLNAGNGTLTMVGESSSNHGIELSAWLDSAGASYLDISAYAINISGSSSKVNANGFGTSQLSNEYTRLSAGAGGIYLYGNNTVDTTRGIEISLNASTSGGGDITLVSPNKVNLYTGTNSKSFNAGTGDITLKTNTLTIQTGTTLSGSGSLTLVPYTDSTTIGVAGGVGTLSLAASYFTTNFVDGFEKIVLGSATQTGNITLGALTLQDNLTLYTQGHVTQTGAITGEQDLVLLGTGGSYTLTNSSNNIASLSANTGSITYLDSNALSLKNISATGVIDIATQAGDLTLTQAITTSDTSDSAIILNSGKSTTAGTSTGGNILVSGGSVGTGSGGRATLYTGSINDSIGLSSLVSSGHFRYNSDASVANYSASLAEGIYAIYREQPILSVTPSIMSSTYGNTVNLSSETYTLSGYKNGDDSTTSSIAGTAVFTTTATNTSNVGNYNIVYNSGLSNALGYAISDKELSTNEYTITARPITVTADAVSKTYGEVNPSLTYQISSGNLVNSDTLSGSLSTLATQYSTVGTYAISSNLANSNYAVTYVPANLSITPHSATASSLITQMTAFYGQTYQLPEFSCTPSGLETMIKVYSLTGIDVTSAALAHTLLPGQYTVKVITDNPQYDLHSTIVTLDVQLALDPITLVRPQTDASTLSSVLLNTPTATDVSRPLNTTGQIMALGSVSMEGVPTELVSLQEIRRVLALGERADVRIPLGQNSLIQLINGGIRFPSGLDQEFFVEQH